MCSRLNLKRVGSPKTYPTALVITSSQVVGVSLCTHKQVSSTSLYKNFLPLYLAIVSSFKESTALLSFRYGMIPPTINCEQLIPQYGLDLVQNEARPLSLSTTLIGGRGIGGANVVLAIRKV